MVIVKVLWEPELLGPWKAAWDRLIWKAMIPKVKAIEGELNWNPRHLWWGDLICIHTSLYSSPRFARVGLVCQPLCGLLIYLE